MWNYKSLYVCSKYKRILKLNNRPVTSKGHSHDQLTCVKAYDGNNIN